MNSQAYWKGYAEACLECGVDPQGLQKQAVMVGGYDVPEEAIGALVGGGLGTGIGYGVGGGRGALIGGLGGAGLGAGGGHLLRKHLAEQAALKRMTEGVESPEEVDYNYGYGETSPEDVKKYLRYKRLASLGGPAKPEVDPDEAAAYRRLMVRQRLAHSQGTGGVEAPSTVSRAGVPGRLSPQDMPH